MRPMRTLAIVSQKGGSGKTTVAVHLATCAELHGQNTALIDLDPQANALGWKQRRADTPPDVAACTPDDLRNVLKEARRGGFDLVVLDTPPHTDATAAVAVQHAGLVLVPCRPSTFDLDAIGNTLAIAEL